MAIEKVLVTKKEELQPVHIGSHPGYEFDKYDILPRNGGNKCSVVFYDIAPGKSNYPFHYHTDSEEIFYIISGQGVVETNEGEIPVSSGSIVVCPSGKDGAHRITNKSDDEVLSYIDISTIPKADMCIYPKTGKIAIYTNDGFAKLFMPDSNVGYYEGE